MSIETLTRKVIFHMVNFSEYPLKDLGNVKDCPTMAHIIADESGIALETVQEILNVLLEVTDYD